MKELQFEYFRGMEAEQYSFYRVPKVLFTEECFKSLSCEAKILYGLMLDRMGLSLKNQWFDEENRVYIIFKVEEIAELMSCGTQKAVKMIKELDTENGIGLIEKKRLGLGRPNVIYVKNFTIRKVWQEQREEQAEYKEPRNDEDYSSGMSEIVIQEYPESQFKNGENHNSEMSETTIQGYPESQFKNGENHNSGMMETTIQEHMGSQFKNGENHNSGIVKTTVQEYPKSQFRNDENHNSGIVEITKQEVPKSQSNKTDDNETDSSETDLIQSYLIPANEPGFTGTKDVVEQMDFWRETVRERISYYDCYRNASVERRENVDELVELIVEIMLLPDDSTLRIAGTDRPAAVVKSRFMKLEQNHVEYVLWCLGRNTTRIGNIKAYLLTTLYNATMTIHHFYQAEVRHDMYGTG